MHQMATHDYEKDQMSNTARIKALNKYEFDEYKKITEGGMTKAEIRSYIHGDQEAEMRALEQVQKEQREKEYPAFLKNP